METSSYPEQSPADMATRAMDLIKEGVRGPEGDPKLADQMVEEEVGTDGEWLNRMSELASVVSPEAKTAVEDLLKVFAAAENAGYNRAMQEAMDALAARKKAVAAVDKTNVSNFEQSHLPT